MSEPIDVSDVKTATPLVASHPDSNVEDLYAEERNRSISAMNHSATPANTSMKTATRITLLAIYLQQSGNDLARPQTDRRGGQ